MKIKKTRYVLMRTGDVNVERETVFLRDNCSEGIEFVNDIREATKFPDRRDALWVKNNYEDRKNNSCDSGFQIIPLKITYEW